MVPLAASAIQTGLGGLMSVFRFGHAKAVAAENNALGAADTRTMRALKELENQVNAGGVSDVDIDARLQAVLDEYYSTVAGVIKGKISTRKEFNDLTKKTSSGGPCNAACVIGGDMADMVNDARPKLKALAAQARKSTGGPAASKSNDPSFAEASVMGGGAGPGLIGAKIAAAAAPVLGSWVNKIPPVVLGIVLPGGGLLLLYLLFRKRWKRGK